MSSVINHLNRTTAKPYSSGFTLLEVLVALFIVGITLGAVGLSIGVVTTNKQLNQSATHIINWLGHARDLAVISHSTYKVASSDASSAMLQEYRGSEWQEALRDRSRYNLAESQTMEWQFETEDQTELFIYPDATYTPFDLLLKDGDDGKLIVIGDGFNPPEIYKEVSS